MPNMIGMDSSEVRKLAGRLEGQAQSLQVVITQVDHIVLQIGQSWHGPVATDFIGWWQQKHRPALCSVQAAVAGLSRSADENARQQEIASSRTHAAPRSTFGFVNRGTQQQQDGAIATLKQHTSSLASFLGWWNELGKTAQGRSEQRHLLLYAGGYMATLPMLRPYMNLYGPTMESQLVEEGSGSISAGIGPIRFTAGVGETVTLDDESNGAATVTLTGDALVSAAKNANVAGIDASAGIGLEGDASVTYKFANRDQAKAFYDSIVGTNDPQSQDLASIVRNLHRATSDPHLDVVSTKYSGELVGSVHVSAAESGSSLAFNASGAASYTRDLTRHTQTFDFRVDGSAASQFRSVAGGHISGDASIQVVTGDGVPSHVQEVIVSAQGSATVSHGDAANGALERYTMTITPSSNNADDIHNLLQSLSHGDMNHAAVQVRKLADNSDQVWQTDNTGSISVSHHGGGSLIRTESSLSDSMKSVRSIRVQPSGESTSMVFP